MIQGSTLLCIQEAPFGPLKNLISILFLSLFAYVINMVIDHPIVAFLVTSHPPHTSFSLCLITIIIDASSAAFPFSNLSLFTDIHSLTTNLSHFLFSYLPTFHTSFVHWGFLTFSFFLFLQLSTLHACISVFLLLASLLSDFW